MPLDSQSPTLRGLTLALATVAALLLVGCSTAPPKSAPTDYGIPPPPPSEISDQQAQDAAVYALGLVGTPYRYGGNTPESGFDCSGLIGFVYRYTAGLQVPRTVRAISGWGDVIDRSQLRTGDLVIFGSSGNATHAGIFVGEGRFVHAPSTGGTVRMDSMDARYWAQRLMAVRRP